MLHLIENILGAVPLEFHVFMLFTSITLGGAVGVAFSQNLIYSAFSLLATFAGVMGLFGFMSADFLAIIQMMVYVGGILVLVLFAVMLTNKITTVEKSNPSHNIVVGLGAMLSVLLGVGAAVLGFDWQVLPQVPAYHPTSQAIGQAFLGRYLFGFEMASIILLVAMLAAVVIARKEVKH